MKQKFVELVLALGALVFGLCLSADAQQSRKILRIGYLSAGGDPSRESSRAEAI